MRDFLAAISEALYAAQMIKVTACDVPEGSLLAGFGGGGDYCDCFCAEAAGEVALGEFIARFYGSMAFLPERLVLGLIGRGASRDDIRALARGETDRFAAWEVIERRSGLVAEHGERPSRKGDRPPAGPESRGDRSADALRKTKTQQQEEILLLSKGTGTASWLAVEPTPTGTRLLFGSWVGNLEQSVWRSMLWPHVWYSRTLLASALKSLSR